MKRRFSEIQSVDDIKLVNEAMRAAISNLPEDDKRDGYALLALIEEKRWYGKLEYPVEPTSVKCAFNIKRAVFHSSQIIQQKGKWRFTRTEFNRAVEFKGDRTNEKNCTDSE